MLKDAHVIELEQKIKLLRDHNKNLKQDSIKMEDHQACSSEVHEFYNTMDKQVFPYLQKLHNISNKLMSLQELAKVKGTQLKGVLDVVNQLEKWLKGYLHTPK